MGVKMYTKFVKVLIHWARMVQGHCDESGSKHSGHCDD